MKNLKQENRKNISISARTHTSYPDSILATVLPYMLHLFLSFIYSINQSIYKLVKICMIVYQLKGTFVDIASVDYIIFN